MRIVICGATANYGGTEAYIMTFLKQMDPQYIQFDFLFSHDTGEIPYEDEILSRGGRIFREYYKNRERHRPDYIPIPELFDRHPEWDGVYINAPNINTTYRLLIEAYRRNLPYRIIHAHSSNYLKKPNIKDRIYKLYFDLTKKRVVTNYLACAEKAGKWMFGKSKFEVIPNAIEFEKYTVDDIVRNNIREKLDLGKDEIVIGFCGRLTHPKRPELLIRVFTKLRETIPNSSLLIIGDGKKMEELRSTAADLKLTDKVIFTGAVNNVKDWLQVMDCFVLPSYFEGFPVALMEAQAAGLRCTTSKEAVPPEVNITNRVEFVSNTASPEEWAEAIINAGFDRMDTTNIMMNSSYTLKALKTKMYAVFGIGK